MRPRLIPRCESLARCSIRVSSDWESRNHPVLSGPERSGTVRRREQALARSNHKDPSLSETALPFCVRAGQRGRAESAQFHDASVTDREQAVRLSELPSPGWWVGGGLPFATDGQPRGRRKNQALAAAAVCRARSDQRPRGREAREARGRETRGRHCPPRSSPGHPDQPSRARRRRQRG